MYTVFVHLCSVEMSYVITNLYFVAIIGNLTEMKQVPGVITGKQQGGSSMYIPAIYSKSQNDWVNTFYKQNGYLGMFKPVIAYLF